MAIEALKKKAARIRLDCLEMTSKAGYGYVGSMMSVADILVTLYYGDLGRQKVMNFDPKKPQWDGQDYMVLSKGHAAGALYAILADLGFFDKHELDFFGQLGGILTTRPNPKIPGVFSSGVSQGNGLSFATGIALALKSERKPNKVFAVLGDGELQEGQVWEAAMAAGNFRLNNLIVFIDNNKVQADGLVSSSMDIYPLQDKFEAFGWNVIQVTNGHNFEQILDAVERAFTSNRRPSVIWCHTICGKGIEFAEGKVSYQGVSLSENEMSIAAEKLKENL
ncbi:MAG: transketolase [Candidatus Peregrinibacteria bacterium]|nr:transketolase [Candidatus Peregrinibacteria bacterium]